MPVFELSEELIFPDVSWAEPDGLLAVGGDLSPERLMLAYQSGIFPWYDEAPILWWSLNPRFVLFPQEAKYSHSMRQILNRNTFQITINQAFRKVITACSEVTREGQFGTWITDEMLDAYCKLHELGHAHSVEAWQDGKLVGGLYGVKMKRVFCGESMFSKVSNASKAAFLTYVKQLTSEGIEIIDCQSYTKHLASLGARFIPRKEFLKYL